MVKQQARRLGQLVDDILNLSRLEMGKQRVVFGPVDLNFVVEQIVAAHQPRAESSGLALSFVPLVDLQPVRGEVNQLAQVVTNLVINALNYTPAGSGPGDHRPKCDGGLRADRRHRHGHRSR